MKNFEIEDPLFRSAAEAIEAGDITTLAALIAEHPKLVQNRFYYPDGGYFKNPHLLWFVSDNPIRIGKLPANIVEITELLINEIKDKSPENAIQQFDYTLGLVASGRVPRECGVQIALIDLLIDAGARPNSGMSAVAHGNLAAAQHLIDRGAILTLAAAVCLDQMEEVIRLLPNATNIEQLGAITAAAFYGKAEMISFLLEQGVGFDGFPERGSGFHQHATPLHQAVYSGSLESVKLLVEAGARLDIKDKVYGGTPFAWAEHVLTEDSYDEEAKTRFTPIVEYLREKSAVGE